MESDPALCIGRGYDTLLAWRQERQLPLTCF